MKTFFLKLAVGEYTLIGHFHMENPEDMKQIAVEITGMTGCPVEYEEVHPPLQRRDGTPWAKVDDVQEGDVLEADMGFDCIEPGAQCVVQVSPINDELYVACANGEHDLECQRATVDGQELYLGFVKVGGSPAPVPRNKVH